MVQLVAIVICAWLGWRRDAFLRWPLGVIVVATLAGALLLVTGSGFQHGPPLDALLLRSTVSMIAFPLLAYWIAWLIAGAIGRRRGKSDIGVVDRVL